MHLRYGVLLAFTAACGSSTSYSNSPAAPPPPPAPGTTLVTIVDSAYAPDTITIKSGTPVQWSNNGAVAHSVTADGGSFDSGSLAGKGTDIYGTPTAGAKFTKTFGTVGTFAYHCIHHASMHGTVVVTN